MIASPPSRALATHTQEPATAAASEEPAAAATAAAAAAATSLSDLPADVHRVIAAYLRVKHVRALLCVAKLFSAQLDDLCADLRQSVHGWRERAAGLTQSAHLDLLEASAYMFAWRHDRSVVVDGHRIISINVGGIARPTHRAFGMSPPAQGDTFTGPMVMLRRGDYTFTVKGGINVHHGISTFSLCRVGHGGEILMGSIDWCDRQTRSGITFTLLVTIPRTEKVFVKCVIADKSAESRNYWHAFSDFELRRRPEISIRV
jgi:hypothetical protein